MAVMLIGLVATFIAILVAAIIFVMINRGGSGAAKDARFGVLIGIFVVCAFVLHIYVNLNIGLRLALGQTVAYFLQWTIVGIGIGLIYKPLPTPSISHKEAQKLVANLWTEFAAHSSEALATNGKELQTP